MTFEELRQRLRWVCDDGVNSEDLDVLYPNMDGSLINEAVRSLADCLNIIKYSNTVTYASTGLVTLPSDFMEILRIRYCETDLTPLADAYEVSVPNDEDDDDDSTDSTVTKFMVLTRNSIQLYNTPTTIPTTLTVTPIGTPGTTTYGYRVSATTTAGTSILCAEVTTATGNATLSATNYNALAWTAVANATEYNIYRTTGGLTQGLLGTATTATYTDDGDVATTVSTDALIMHLWYKAYPAALTATTDVPTDIPLEYHSTLVDKYAKAQFVLKKGNMQLYGLLMQEWEAVRRHIRGSVDARSMPTNAAPNTWIW